MMLWIIFALLSAMLLAIDLVALGSGRISMTRSAIVSAVHVVVGLFLGAVIFYVRNANDALDYITGYVIEKALAMDNLFVMVMIFDALKIPTKYHMRVLFWGVLGAVVMRAIVIFAGTALVSRFHWVLELFAVFMIVTGIKMMFRRDKQDNNVRGLRLVNKLLPTTNVMDGEKFFVRTAGAWLATPLFVALVLVELADFMFALDSISAVFAVTTDTFLIYSSNIFAILGLRALYFLLAHAVENMRYLHYSISLLLILAGAKIFAGDSLPSGWMLLITCAILMAGVVVSLIDARIRARVNH